MPSYQFSQAIDLAIIHLAKTILFFLMQLCIKRDRRTWPTAYRTVTEDHVRKENRLQGKGKYHVLNRCFCWDVCHVSWQAVI